MTSLNFVKQDGQYIGHGDTVSFNHEETLCSFIEKQTQKTPDAIALYFKESQLTFKEVHEQSNRLAHYLLGCGVHPQDKIAVYLEPGISTFIAIIAIIKTGCCYVPLDAHYPIERISFMVKDSETTVLITDSHLKERVGSLDLVLIKLDKILHELEGLSPLFTARAQSSNRAYMMYTSGSTGVPKGVEITHLALLNHMLWISQRFDISHQDIILQKTPLSFDPSIWELFLPFFTGAQLVIAPQGTHIDTELLMDLINHHQVTILQLVPSILKKMLQNKRIRSCSSLRYVFVGGESLRPEIKTLFFEQLRCQLVNLYGPTEATIDITSQEVSTSSKDLHTNIIGRPIHNTSLYVVNSQGNLAKLGEEGELYIGSLSLAAGYHHRAPLTQEHFLTNPFEPHRFKLIYKTGDWVRWLPSGVLEYLGRNNDQVKINGVRIEPKELILTVLHHDEVSDCFVVKKSDTHGHDYLACYLKSKHTHINLAAIKKDLKAKFPAFMLPRVFIIIEHIPLTVNGKVDINALPEPDFTQTVLEAPNTNEETHELMLLWQKILETNQISPNDNFFDSGGASLLALKLISLIQDQFKVTLRIRDLYTHPTLKEQMNLIKQRQQAATKPIKNQADIPNPIICLQPSGHKTPLFLIHPIGGTIFWFTKLARALEKQRPIYGIQDPGIDVERPILNSIEEMASFYLNHIKAIQPHGPYLIGGASFGASVAAQIAHELKRHNEEVASLIVLDGWGVYPNTLLDDHYFKTSMARQHAELVNDFIKYGLPKPEILLDIQWFRLNLLWKFEMQLIESPMALFKSQNLLPAFAEIDAPLNHWEQFSNNEISRYITPGNHETMFQEPHVDSLARMVQEHLTKINI
ncbi:amino acid adenylation domain-containing protein [Legionella lytica]|uniref:Amino acid adenylation domain-containing protein n=1 Tax=Legionella lytica TaxID=96232 RepID=A0ABW8DB18_9GAMM